MKKLTPFILAAMLAVASPMAVAQLGKGGGKGGGKTGGSTGGSSGGSSTGGKSTSGGSGGGAKPPTRGNSNPPKPPVRNGGGSKGGSSGGSGGLGRGGSSGSSSSSNRGGSTSSGSNRGGSTNPPVNRDRNGSTQTQRGNSGQITGRGNSDRSRSGNVTYRSNSNQNNSTRSSGGFNIPQPPTVRSNSRIGSEAYREAGQIRRSADYRNGYYHYNRNWNDNNFWYPYYSFSYQNNCYPSPFYYYPHLPGYVSGIRITIGGSSWNVTGSYYNWSYNRNSSYDWGWGNNRNDDRYNRELDYAVDDIYDSFRRGSMRYIGNLIPTRGRVTVELGRYARYQLNTNDFYDMMRDLVEGTDTNDYRIRRVRQNGRQVSIEAEHKYRDPWGRYRTVEHFYGLEQSGRRYEIVYFSSSD